MIQDRSPFQRLILSPIQNLNVLRLRSDRRRCNIFALRRNSLQYNNNIIIINNNNNNIASIVASVIDFPIVGVFVAVFVRVTFPRHFDGVVQSCEMSQI